MVVLRKYQKEGVRKIVDAWKSEKDNSHPVIFQKPMASVLLLLRKKNSHIICTQEKERIGLKEKKALLDRTSAGSFSPISFIRII